MRIVHLTLLSLALFGAACPKDAEAPPAATTTTTTTDAPGAAAVRALTEFADKVCACPDAACAERERLAFDERNRSRTGPTPAPPDAAAMEKLTQQSARLGACVAKLSMK